MKKLILILLLTYGCSDLGECDVYVGEYDHSHNIVVHLKRNCDDKLVYGDIRALEGIEFCSKCVGVSDKKRLERVIRNHAMSKLDYDYWRINKSNQYFNDNKLFFYRQVYEIDVMLGGIVAVPISEYKNIKGSLRLDKESTVDVVKTNSSMKDIIYVGDKRGTISRENLNKNYDEIIKYLPDAEIEYSLGSKKYRAPLSLYVKMPLVGELKKLTLLNGRQASSFSLLFGEEQTTIISVDRFERNYRDIQRDYPDCMIFQKERVNPYFFIANFLRDENTIAKTYKAVCRNIDSDLLDDAYGYFYYLSNIGQDGFVDYINRTKEEDIRYYENQVKYWENYQQQK